MLAEEPLKAGQIIDYEGDRYRVVGVYSHHVLLEDVKKKIKWDVENADLMVAGIVRQKGERFEVEKQIKNMDRDHGNGLDVSEGKHYG